MIQLSAILPSGTENPRKTADFALLDRDITRIDPIEIRDARVELTVVGGRVVYRAAEG